MKEEGGRVAQQNGHDPHNDVENEVVAGRDDDQGDRRPQERAATLAHRRDVEDATPTPIANAKPACRLGTAATGL